MNMLRLSDKKFAKRFVPTACWILSPFALSVIMGVLVLMIPPLGRTPTNTAIILLVSVILLVSTGSCIVAPIYLASNYVKLKKTRLFWSKDLIIYTTNIPEYSDVSDTAIICGVKLPPEISMETCVNVTEAYIEGNNVVVVGDLSILAEGSQSTEKVKNAKMVIPNVYNIDMGIFYKK